jgi:hypothetical protein
VFGRRHHLAERDTLPARFGDKAGAQSVRSPIALEAPEPRTPLHDPRDMIGAEGGAADGTAPVFGIR